MIVVNCAGRTRSIIGAQSLINAGVPNKVVALRNGTMGWSLAGLTCESGKSRRAPGVSPAILAWAKEAAQRVAQRCGVRRIDRPTLTAWRADTERTLYVFDVRDPTEYAAGHLPGALSAPGGQLVQATDHYIGTLGARIVLVDDAAVRALMTASWLRQMGWQDVFVLVEAGSEAGLPAAPTLTAETQGDAALIDCTALQQLLDRNAATVVDLSVSRDYLKGHIPGAWFAIRTRLKRALEKIPVRGTLVLASEDGVLAQLAVPEAAALLDTPVRALAGGNTAWQAAGLAFSVEPYMADEPIDQWRKPYERANDTTAAMSEYLAWETDLLSAVERDASAKFCCVGQ
jgi:rhodanese-related sulfurtransferase